MGLHCHRVHLEEISKNQAIASTLHSAALENLSHLGNKDTEREKMSLSSLNDGKRVSSKHHSTAWQSLLRV